MIRVGIFFAMIVADFEVFLPVFYKTVISLALVGYKIVIANEARSASLAITIYHLISNARSWNNC